MSVEISNGECQKFVMNEKSWGSYSGSEYSTSAFSNLSSSPMECSSKLDETSSLCSSNSSTIGEVRLPKPPQSLRRRKQRKRCEPTSEVFEFSDLVPESISLKPDPHGMFSNQAHIENDNMPNGESQTTKDRYEVLRNINVNDNYSFSVPKSQDPDPHQTNPFAPAFLKTRNIQPATTKDICKTQDKYAAISQAIRISEPNSGGNCENLKWSRSVVENANCGWSDQVLHGEESCQ